MMLQSREEPFMFKEQYVLLVAQDRCSSQNVTVETFWITKDAVTHCETGIPLAHAKILSVESSRGRLCHFRADRDL